MKTNKEILAAMVIEYLAKVEELNSLFGEIEKLSVKVEESKTIYANSL